MSHWYPPRGVGPYKLQDGPAFPGTWQAPRDCHHRHIWHMLRNIFIYCEFPVSCISICQLPKGSCLHVSCPTFNPRGFATSYRWPSLKAQARGLLRQVCGPGKDHLQRLGADWLFRAIVVATVGRILFTVGSGDHSTSLWSGGQLSHSSFWHWNLIGTSQFPTFVVNPHW